MTWQYVEVIAFTLFIKTEFCFAKHTFLLQTHKCRDIDVIGPENPTTVYNCYLYVMSDLLLYQLLNSHPH